MSVLSGACIRRAGLVSPCVARTQHNGMTFGLSVCGYDVRVEFDAEGAIPGMMLEPGGFMLASTIERFTMTEDVVGIVHDKSTWARRGLTVQNTVIEPGWSGYLTLELSNHGPKPLVISRGDPIAQVLFHRVMDPIPGGYKGKYQDQERGPVVPR